MSDTAVLFETPKVHVFSLPPTDFLKSDNWEGNYIWSGTLKFIREGSFFAVRLVEKDSNELFGECPIRENPSGTPATAADGSNSNSSGDNKASSAESVQPASDSTRAFVLRVEEGDQFSYVGLLFDDRTVAYNFSSALIHRRKGLGPAPTLPVHDHTLSQGESITVDLFNKVKNSTAANSNSAARTEDPFAAVPASPASGVTGSYRTNSDNGVIPRVNLFSLEVSTSGKSRRVKVDSLAMQQQQQQNAAGSPTAVASPTNANTVATSAAKTNSIDDIFSSPSPASVTQQQPAGNNNSKVAAIDPFGDVFASNSNSSNANRPQQQQPTVVASSTGGAKKDILDDIFG